MKSLLFVAKTLSNVNHIALAFFYRVSISKFWRRCESLYVDLDPDKFDQFKIECLKICNQIHCGELIWFESWGKKPTMDILNEKIKRVFDSIHGLLEMDRENTDPTKLIKMGHFLNEMQIIHFLIADYEISRVSTVLINCNQKLKKYRKHHQKKFSCFDSNENLNGESNEDSECDDSAFWKADSVVSNHTSILKNENEEEKFWICKFNRFSGNSENRPFQKYKNEFEKHILVFPITMEALKSIENGEKSKLYQRFFDVKIHLNDGVVSERGNCAFDFHNLVKGVFKTNQDFGDSFCYYDLTKHLINENDFKEVKRELKADDEEEEGEGENYRKKKIKIGKYSQKFYPNAILKSNEDDVVIHWFTPLNFVFSERIISFL